MIVLAASFEKSPFPLGIRRLGFCGKYSATWAYMDRIRVVRSKQREMIDRKCARHLNDD